MHIPQLCRSCLLTLLRSLAAFFRALPNFNLIRPADAEEVLGAWEVALDSQHTPTLMTLSRQGVPLLEHSDRTKVHKGAYPIFANYDEGNADPELVLIATGSEVWRAVEAAKKLAPLRTRVVSMPIQSVLSPRRETEPSAFFCGMIVFTAPMAFA